MNGERGLERGEANREREKWRDEGSGRRRESGGKRGRNRENEICIEREITERGDEWTGDVPDHVVIDQTWCCHQCQYSGIAVGKHLEMTAVPKYNTMEESNSSLLETLAVCGRYRACAQRYTHSYHNTRAH